MEFSGVFRWALRLKDASEWFRRVSNGVQGLTGHFGALQEVSRRLSNVRRASVDFQID